LTIHPKQSAYTEARIAYWEEYSKSTSRFDVLRRGYKERLAEFYRFLIPPGMRVLELGSGDGDLLAAVEPSVGVGVDFCPSMIHRAHAEHPGLRFVEADAHFVDLKGDKFDFIIVSDLVNDLWNVQQMFSNVLRFAHPGTRIIINAYSRLWEGPRRIAEWTGFVAGSFVAAERPADRVLCQQGSGEVVAHPPSRPDQLRDRAAASAGTARAGADRQRNCRRPQ
jgi:2-polyprenyl-3-methyl-5-hydroxy-6-metoxy-1,4-benzoquinol methylase